MTRSEIRKMIEEKAAEVGLVIVKRPMESFWVDYAYEDNFALVGVNGSHEYNYYDNTKPYITGKFYIGGGYCTRCEKLNADQLFAAADQARRAAEFLSAFSGMDLTYYEDADGNPVQGGQQA